jgi:hypothetical protein
MGDMQWLGMFLLLAAGLAWLSAATHALLLLPHRSDEVSVWALAVQGHRFYRQSTWKPSGHALHARFVRSALAFFALVVLGMIVSAIAASSAH